MPSAFTNFCHSFVNTLVHIWAVVLSLCSSSRYPNPDITTDLEKGPERPQSEGQPLSVPSPASPSPGQSGFSSELAASPFRRVTCPPPPVKCNSDLAQRTIASSGDPEHNPGVPQIKTLDGRDVQTFPNVKDDASASGNNLKCPISPSCDVSGMPACHADSPSRSISSHVRNTSFDIASEVQDVSTPPPAFIGHPLSPFTFPSHLRRGKGHKREPLATVTNISHVMGPSSPVVETFIIPKPSSVTPLMLPMASGTPPPTHPPLFNGVAGQRNVQPPPTRTSTPPPRLSPSVNDTPVTPWPTPSPATPTSEKSLRRVSAFDNFHSPSPSRKSPKAPPSSSRKKRPVSSVVWFKDFNVTPTVPLRIAKRCAILSPLTPAARISGRGGVTEEALEEEVFAVKEAFAETREDEADGGVAARQRFDRASVWTTRTNRSSVIQSDEHMRNILDEDEEGYGEELPSSSLVMCSPPPPYPLSLFAVHITDKIDYKITTAEGPPLASQSTELSYLCSPGSVASCNGVLDDLLVSFEDLISTMPSRLKTPKELRQALVEKVAKGSSKAANRRQSEVAQESGEYINGASCGIVEVAGTVSHSERDRHWSDDFELDAYAEAP
jgi:hypothetical protein